MKKISISMIGLTVICASMFANATESQGVSARESSASPSGNEIVFVADYDGKSGLWITSADGKSMRKLISNGTVVGNPVWSPDGKRIVFASKIGKASDIWVIDQDGKGLTRLTSGVGRNKQPAWSPDGLYIGFVSDRAGSGNDIWIMKADGSEQKRVTTLSGQENHPSFSPDGAEIVFSHTVDQASLKIIKKDGTGLRNLTAGSARDWDPNWSRFGIVFTAQRASDQSKIWTVQPDGSGLKQVGDIPGNDPSWMPDGRILFTDSPESSAAKSAISVVNAVTGVKRVVTTVEGFLTPIDVRPGKTPNRINPDSGGKVSAAILSRSDFDPVASVDQSTLTFGRTGSEKSLYSCGSKAQGSNSDKQRGLVCRFQIKVAGFKLGDQIAILRFTDKDGTPYEGRDVITTVTEDDSDDL